MADVLNVEILQDGTVRTEVVGHVSPANHASAEGWLKGVQQLTGGETVRQKRGHGHSHHHQQGEHTHEH